MVTQVICNHWIEGSTPFISLTLEEVSPLKFVQEIVESAITVFGAWLIMTVGLQVVSMIA